LSGGYGASLSEISKYGSELGGVML
jgi:hypothetical protein